LRETRVVDENVNLGELRRQFAHNRFDLRSHPNVESDRQDQVSEFLAKRLQSVDSTRCGDNA
jgi:hypothetical protein